MGGKKIHQLRDADAGRGGNCKDRDESLLTQCPLEAGADFIVAQFSLLKKFLQQGVIRLRNVFHQLLVQFFHTILPVSRQVFSAELTDSSQVITVKFSAHDFDQLVKTRTGVDR